jgi:hypothetical protein
MSKLVLVFLLLSIHLTGICPDRYEDRRTLSGIIYFTNNTPGNLDTFPVELYSRDGKRRVGAVTADKNGGFVMAGIRPGKYLLKFVWPPRSCTLWYRVDVTRESRNDIKVIMDAACGTGQSGKIRDLPEN